MMTENKSMAAKYGGGKQGKIKKRWDTGIAKGLKKQMMDMFI